MKIYVDSLALREYLEKGDEVARCKKLIQFIVTELLQQPPLSDRELEGLARDIVEMLTRHFEVS